MSKQNQPLTVELGRIVATPGALDALNEAGVSPADLLRRHHSGDWGNLSVSDQRANDRAARNGGERILSAYTLPNGVKVWIITEADRSSTCLLLPEEY
jgi:hypothetical protein